MSGSHESYPSDVSDDKWTLVAPYLTLLPENAGQRSYPLREVFNRLCYIVKTDAPCRWMPNDLPPRRSFISRRNAGFVRDVLKRSRRICGCCCVCRLGHEAQPRAAIIDSRTLRSTLESGARAGYDGAKCKKGSKLHLAVGILSATCSHSTSRLSAVKLP